MRAVLPHTTPHSATRAVCALSEARAHAIAAARTPADRAALLGDDEVQLWMEQLQDRMGSIASNAGVFAEKISKSVAGAL